MPKTVVILIAFIVAAIAVVVVMQSRLWQTGRTLQPPFELVSGGPDVPILGRIWIDTDAACGAADRTDPDDCFAILWLVLRDVDIVGVSTSFGNASGEVVAEQLAALVAKMAQDDLPVPPVFTGYGAPRNTQDPLPSGVTALRTALEAGPLTILALGPLTNIAAALDGRPDLHANVLRVIAVMGHQPGHLFHPTEGKGNGALFGHGPIFRDLNVSVDPEATRAVLAMRLPMILIPYDAARATLITGADLDSLALHSPPQAWVAQTSRPWLAFWNDDVGLPGFYPFDWIAAAYLTDPAMFNCAKVSARMTREWTFWIVPHESLVVETPSGDADPAGPVVLYCPETSGLLHNALMAQ